MKTFEVIGLDYSQTNYLLRTHCVIVEVNFKILVGVKSSKASYFARWADEENLEYKLVEHGD